MTVTIHYKGQIATELGSGSEELSFDKPLPLIEILNSLSKAGAEKFNDFIFNDHGKSHVFFLQLFPQYLLQILNLQS